MKCLRSLGQKILPPSVYGYNSKNVQSVHNYNYEVQRHLLSDSAVSVHDSCHVATLLTLQSTP
jgi:hypothetical protein